MPLHQYASEHNKPVSTVPRVKVEKHFLNEGVLDVGLTYMQCDQDGNEDANALALEAAAKAKARAAAACKQARRDKQPSREDEMRARLEKARLYSARLHKAKGSPADEEPLSLAAASAAAETVVRDLDATLQHLLHPFPHGPAAATAAAGPLAMPQPAAEEEASTCPTADSSITLSPGPAAPQQLGFGFLSVAGGCATIEELGGDFDDGYEAEDEVGGWGGSERGAAALRRIRVTAEAEVHNLPSSGIEEEEPRQQQQQQQYAPDAQLMQPEQQQPDAAPTVLEPQWGEEEEEEGEGGLEGEGVAQGEGREQEEEVAELLPSELARMRLLMHATARVHPLAAAPSPARPWHQGTWSVGGAAVSASSPGGGQRGASSPGGHGQLQQQQGWEQDAAASPQAAHGVVVAKFSNVLGGEGSRPRGALSLRPRLRYNGALLPNCISVQDEEGMRRIAAKAHETGARLPALCSCHGGLRDMFDPGYVFACARNCPLYGRTQEFEHLLTSALIAAGVL